VVHGFLRLLACHQTLTGRVPHGYRLCVQDDGAGGLEIGARAYEPIAADDAHRVTWCRIPKLWTHSSEGLYLLVCPLVQDDGAGGLEIGARVTGALVDVVRALNVRPRFLIAKVGRGRGVVMILQS
jgi:hypothetical protein